MTQPKYPNYVSFRPAEDRVRYRSAHGSSSQYVSFQLKPDQPKPSGDAVDRATAKLFSHLLPLLYGMLCVAMALCALLFLYLFLFGQPKHGETLSDFARNVAGENVEYGAAFTLDGKIIYEVTDHSASAVDAPVLLTIWANLVSKGDYVSAHNHPNGDARPSTYDVLAAVQREPAKSIVIGDNCHSSLEAPSGWPSLEEVEAYMAQATEQTEAGSNNVNYCLRGDYIELFNYPDIVEDFLQTFHLVYTEGILV